MVRPSRHAAGASVTHSSSTVSTNFGASYRTLAIVCAAAAAVGAGVRWYWRSRQSPRQSCPPGNSDEMSLAVLGLLNTIEKTTALRSGSPLRSSSIAATPTAVLEATEVPPLPLAVVDADAFRENVLSMAVPVLQQRKGVRIVTKSIRVPHLIEMAAEIVREEHRRMTQLDGHKLTSLRKDVSGSGSGSAASDSLEDFVHVESGSQAPPASPKLHPPAAGSTAVDVRATAAAPRKAAFDPVSGIMTFSAKETRFWVRRRSFSSILLAYPVCDAGSVAVLADAIIEGQQELSGHAKVWCLCTVDDIHQVALLVRCLQERLANNARPVAVVLKLVIDVDMSYRPLGHALHLGVRRSPIRTDRDVAALVSAIDALSQSLSSERISRVEVVGVMGYEAQVAGVQDVPFAAGPLTQWIGGVATRFFKSLSTAELVKRRSSCVDRLHLLRHAASCVTDGPLLVNGGGSGSVLTTASDASVTEVSVGSGALCGHLFDRYHNNYDAAGRCCCSFHPALFVFLPVCRVASQCADRASSLQACHVTCNGGGWIASGPVQPDRAPIVVYPPVGLSTLSTEGFGEVQTPFSVHQNTSCDDLTHGSVVIVRPAKSGELAEVFSSYTVLSSSRDPIMVKTYRGEGVDSW